MREHTTEPVDPFDLPEWLGVEEVTWVAESRLEGHLVRGSLRAGGGDPPPLVLPCDLLAGDLAHPAPVLADAWRTGAHLAWSLGEVSLVSNDGRATLVVPGSVVSVELLLEAVRRLARAVGAPVARFSVCLRL